MGGGAEVAARVITYLRLSSQGARHSTENTQLLDTLLPSEIHPVSLSFLTPPPLASLTNTSCTEHHLQQL